ncbi:Sphingoid long-chain bases kinase [Sesamum angolense]|uniref:Sphingoid long-chain bases kinase n=1 Tax=Sesamum angolense TaxID=2727404 RepID=A0AAE2C6H0_9LAMI|nr:Sphingoid long-chain bases kinase [Sesamum angolense]
MSDPGPIWDAEPRWDSEPNWDIENPIELPGPPDDSEAGNRKETVPKPEENWVVTKGRFLGVMVCNHSCKTVQSLSSQVVAPKAEHNDNSLDLLLVHGSGRLRLLRFLLCLQVGTHVSLPYVEYVKVKSVRIKPGKRTHNGCGIDGKVHGSLARAGKVRGQTPKVAKQDKKKKPRGRAHKRMQYNRRFVTAVVGFGKKRGPNSSEK